jgi:hypothetical protein
MTPAIQHILGQERPRVWSFIVTILAIWRARIAAISVPEHSIG